MPATHEKRTRITTRIPESMRNTLEDAAELIGSPLNQFIVQTAFLEAQRILETESTIHLSRQDALLIVGLIENPPKANGKLKEAIKLFRNQNRGKN